MTAKTGTDAVRPLVALAGANRRQGVTAMTGTGAVHVATVQAGGLWWH